jgi:hypothetical protein
MKPPISPSDDPRAKHDESQNALQATPVGEDVVRTVSTSRNGFEAAGDVVGNLSYIEQTARQFGETASSARAKERRYRLRKSALLAKQAVIVSDLRAVEAAMADREPTATPAQ